MSRMGRKLHSLWKIKPFQFQMSLESNTWHSDSASSDVEQVVSVHTQECVNVNIAVEQKRDDVYANMIIHGKTISVQVDSGATTNIMPQKFLMKYSHLQRKFLQCTIHHLLNPSDNALYA